MISIVEKALEKLDIEAITRDVMSKLFISDLELYFIVTLEEEEVDLGCVGKKMKRRYKFLGMAYSERTARQQAEKTEGAQVYRLDMGEIVEVMQRLGGLKRIV